MAEIQHAKYGQIIVKRDKRARYVRLSVATSGNLQISAPLYTPLLFIKQFLKRSDEQIASLFARHTTFYTAPMQIGKSHRLEVSRGGNNPSRIIYKKPIITLLLSDANDLPDYHAQQLIRSAVVKALRHEAKAYLPRRVDFLAQRLGLDYQKLRFSHAKSRWGSCSSDGTISLNIALMKLDFELIDYVIVHELSHLKEMNHSPRFWAIVSPASPHYKAHRKKLKDCSPHM